MTDLVSYLGSPDCPYPPCAEGWSYVDDDGGALFDAARVEAGQLGALPVSHYTDRLTSAGLFRFFAFDTPVGPQLGALHFDGTLGQQSNSSSGDGGTTDDGSQGTVSKTSDTPGNYAAGGPDGNEPIPQPDANCTQWVPDATNAAAVAIANNISYNKGPVPFQDQAVYDTTISGTRWRFVMWAGDCRGDGGTYHCVSAFRCVPASPHPTPPGPAPSQASMGGIIALLVGGLIVVGGLIAAASGKKPF